MIILASNYSIAESNTNGIATSPTTQTKVATQAANPQQTMAELLQQIQHGRIHENRLHQKREADFLTLKDQQASLLQQAEQQIATATRFSQTLESTFHDNETSLSQQQQRLQQRAGDFGELFGVVRQVAGDTSAQLEQSIISAQLPGRSQLLDSIAKNRDLPTTKEIEKLWFILTQEMHEQGRVITFSAAALNTQGIAVEVLVTRIGAFVGFNASGKFMRYLPATGQLSELARQPRSTYQHAATRLIHAAPGTVVTAPIDPSSGAILSLLIQRPNLLERIQQGGIVGYIVIFIGITGVLLGLERIASLTLTALRIKKQIKEPSNTSSIGNNALGRIFKAFDGADHSNVDSQSIERLELKLDDLILQETPAIRRSLSTLKVLAGVAPLLGLLGTVTGMVETFDVITLFGSGDVKLIAGGISQALITTALGLTVAIPILLLHSVANTRSRSIVETLEEQTAGLLAQYSQKTSTHA